jgi:hypothetical protein
LHAIKHTKPFALKACESLVVEQNVHIAQDECLLQRSCQTTIVLVACASRLSLLVAQGIFVFSSSFEFVLHIVKDVVVIFREAFHLSINP